MEWDFGDVFWTMLVFFFWVMYIWMFIAIFADIFRRRDISGWGKAGWILLIFVLPLIGIVAYVVARPKMELDEAYGPGAYGRPPQPGYSRADEIAKLADLRSKGAISDAEYQQLKKEAVA